MVVCVSLVSGVCPASPLRRLGKAPATLKQDEQEW